MVARNAVLGGHSRHRGLVVGMAAQVNQHPQGEIGKAGELHGWRL
jgi:hypothetical protein